MEETKYLLAIERNSIRLSGSAHGIVTKTLHKTLPLGGRGGGMDGVGLISKLKSNH